MESKKETVSKSEEKLRRKLVYKTLLLEKSDVAVALYEIERAVLGLSSSAFTDDYDSFIYRKMYLKLQRLCNELRDRSIRIDRLLDIATDKLNEL